METVLTILIMYIVAVALYTITLRKSPTNKYAPNFDYWSVIKDGMKGIAIGFAIVGIIYYIIGYILTAIHCGF